MLTARQLRECDSAVACPVMDCLPPDTDLVCWQYSHTSGFIACVLLFGVMKGLLASAHLTRLIRSCRSTIYVLFALWSFDEIGIEGQWTCMDWWLVCSVVSLCCLIWPG